MAKVEIKVASDPNATLTKWALEDSYYEKMTGIAGEINKKARDYPYIASTEIPSTTKSFFMETQVPIQGPLTLIYLDDRSDSGLPHTRGLTGIALPESLLSNPSESTVKHELVHLSQKQVYNRWLHWYKIFWNFRPAKEDEFMRIPKKWRSRRRMNPDTLGSPYMIWSDRYIPLSVFSSETEPDLRNCKRGFWDLKMSQWTWEEPSGWVSLFGSGFNDEHPNEIAAHWLDGSAGKDKQEFFRLHPV
jgi:hypothetical protein